VPLFHTNPYVTQQKHCIEHTIMFQTVVSIYPTKLNIMPICCFDLIYCIEHNVELFFVLPY